MEHRVAIRVKGFEVSTVRNRGEQVGGNLRFFVMPHLDGERRRQGRNAPPLRRSAAPAGVEIADVDRARHHEVSTTRTGYLALPGADRNAGLAARRRHVEAVVLPAHRLFKPANIEVGREPGKFDRLSQCPGLVGVYDKDKILADRLARDPHAFGSEPEFALRL